MHINEKLLQALAQLNMKQSIVILLSCFAAVIVQLSTLTMIKATSAVTYQIVGHAKTCLIIVIGYILFPPSASSTKNSNKHHEAMWKHIVGICIAFGGTVLYSYFKHEENLKQQQTEKKNLEEKTPEPKNDGELVIVEKASSEKV